MYNPFNPLQHSLRAMAEGLPTGGPKMPKVAKLAQNRKILKKSKIFQKIKIISA